MAEEGPGVLDSKTIQDLHAIGGRSLNAKTLSVRGVLCHPVVDPAPELRGTNPAYIIFGQRAGEIFYFIGGAQGGVHWKAKNKHTGMDDSHSNSLGL